MDKITDDTTDKEIFISNDQLRVGLAVFEDWRAAPLGINFGELIANIYTAMRSSEPHVVTFRPQPEPVVVPVEAAPTFQSVSPPVEPVPPPTTQSEKVVRKDVQPKPFSPTAPASSSPSDQLVRKDNPLDDVQSTDAH